MKIVKFKNGQFGLRKFSVFGYVYKDLKPNSTYWWSLSDGFIDSCKTNSYNQVVDLYNKFHDKGTVINLQEKNHLDKNSRSVNILKQDGDPRP
jgi:hypothetical protein